MNFFKKIINFLKKKKIIIIPKILKILKIINHCILTYLIMIQFGYFIKDITLLKRKKNYK